MADWADDEAKEFNRYILLTSGKDRLELLAAKFRELEARGAYRGCTSAGTAIQKSLEEIRAGKSAA